MSEVVTVHEKTELIGKIFSKLNVAAVPFILALVIRGFGIKIPFEISPEAMPSVISATSLLAVATAYFIKRWWYKKNPARTMEINEDGTAQEIID